MVKKLETLQGEKSVVVDDGKDGSSQKEDIAVPVSLEHVADSVEEHVKETDQSIGDLSCFKVWFLPF